MKFSDKGALIFLSQAHIHFKIIFCLWCFVQKNQHQKGIVCKGSPLQATFGTFRRVEKYEENADES